MIQIDRVISLDEKVQLLARDIYDAALLEGSLRLEQFTPSKQLQSILDEDELSKLMTYLWKHDVLIFSYRKISIRTHSRDPLSNGFRPYALDINQSNIRRLLGLENNTSPPAPVESGIRLHPEYSYLLIDGEKIPLGKGKLHKTLQYWICNLCLQNPNNPVQETDIMAMYATDYDITARSRAVRDAVYKLNPKIEAATKINELFTYSNGYVVFNADKLKEA
ncbi:MAG TPA: hypothetical protein VLH38_00860 [Patescibacteria group bacterium]|nr:hypothetical protein [Patescibacteria group bacterium]